jgi:hypothetical protein
MSEQARVESIDSIKLFRRALFKFAEAALTALGDAESEPLRVLMWLETEQTTYWQGQLRKRTELVARCKEAVRMKTLFKDSTGRTPSAIDEQKALQAAHRALQEAEEKVVAVKRYTQKLQKEILIYKGQVQRFATTVQSDVPVWAAKLDAMIAKLEEYVALAAPTSDVALPGSSSDSQATIPLSDDLETMARPEPAPQENQSPADSSKPPDPGE